MPTGRSGHAAAVVRGCLYAFGGEGNAARPDGVFPQNEAYDARRDAWESFAPMPTPRHGIGAAVVGERIFIPGGANLQGLGISPAHEIFTPPRAKSCE
jgi:N-acetylneuraminic acid mutarotase